MRRGGAKEEKESGKKKIQCVPAGGSDFAHCHCNFLAGCSFRGVSHHRGITLQMAVCSNVTEGYYMPRYSSCRQLIWPVLFPLAVSLSCHPMPLFILRNRNTEYMCNVNFSIRMQCYLDVCTLNILLIRFMKLERNKRNSVCNL